MSDLYNFLQHLVITFTLETMCGSKLLELYTTIVNDICCFQSALPQFFRFYPSFLMPRGFSAQERLLDGIKMWHEFALQHSDCSKTGPEDTCGSRIGTASS